MVRFSKPAQEIGGVTRASASEGSMRREEIEQQLAEVREDQELMVRLQEELSRWQEVSAAKATALETLLRLEDLPFADSSTLFEITESLGISETEESTPSVVGEETGRLEPVPAGTLFPGMADRADVLPKEELSRFEECQTILGIADAIADHDDDGGVTVLYVATVMRALGMVSPEWTNIRKQAWGEAYKALAGAPGYEFCGKGTGRFRRIQPPTQLETSTFN